VDVLLGLIAGGSSLSGWVFLGMVGYSIHGQRLVVLVLCA